MPTQIPSYLAERCLVCALMTDEHGHDTVAEVALLLSYCAAIPRNQRWKMGSQSP